MAKSKKDDPPAAGGNSGKVLLGFIERIERLMAEKKAIADDILEVKKELKGSGFDVKVTTWLIKLRASDQDDLDEFDGLVEAYKRAIGMSPDSL